MQSPPPPPGLRFADSSANGPAFQRNLEPTREAIFGSPLGPLNFDVPSNPGQGCARPIRGPVDKQRE
jgi:hypothetical protein